MFEAAVQKIEHKLGDLTHVDLEHVSTSAKLRLAAITALGFGAMAVAEHFHVPKKFASEGVSEIAKLVGTSEIAVTAKAAKASKDDLPVGEWLNIQPKSKVVKLLSPQFAHADKLAERLHAAFREDGDAVGNIEKALNEHSAEFFPYVKPLKIKTAVEDDSPMYAYDGDIYLRGKIERTETGALKLDDKTEKIQGESGLAAAFGHEYNHVEQGDFVPYAYESKSITEAQYQRRERLRDSLEKSDQTMLSGLIADNDFLALRAINYAGKKAMMDANAIFPDKPSIFTSYYHSVLSTPADEIPHSFQSFLNRQKDITSAISPALSEHDIGRQMFTVMRGQIATAYARSKMFYRLYENLYHESEAYKLMDVVKDSYEKL